jgi:nucleoside-diphosphate-sugar epimerase
MYLLHFAAALPGAACTRLQARAANRALSELVTATLVRVKPEGLLFPSSGAVYGTRGWGPIDDYGTQKLTDERVFGRTCKNLGTSIVMPRMFAVGGPCNPHPTRYLLGDLVGCASAGLPLTIRSVGHVYRSYSALTDILAVSLTTLLSGARGELVFDTAGREVVEAAELAQMVRAVLGRPELPILQAPRRAFSDARADTVDRYVGDGSVLRSLAAEAGYDLASLPEIIRQTALQ